jgi:DNA-binding transcriptional LysR family regulator
VLDLRKLQMLAALDRLGTIAAVAEELHLTAPGVSMQLDALQRSTGIALTERRGRRVALTPAGSRLAAHGATLVARVALAEAEIESLKHGRAGEYRVVAFPSAARTFVASAWRSLLGERSELRMRLVTEEPEDALRSLAMGDTDIGVIHSYSNVARALPDGITRIPLGSEPVWLALSSDDGLDDAEIPIAALAGRDWVAPDPSTTCAQMIERACSLAGFVPRIVATSTDFAVQLELVAAGVGVALVPELTVASVPSGVRLVRPAPAPVRELAIVMRTATTEDAGARRLVEALRTAFDSRRRVAGR